MAHQVNRYAHTYTSYSGADIVPTITPIGGKPLVIGELQTVSYSIHRETFPVITLSRINPAGFTKGPRTIAGSLIFTVLDRHIVRKFLSEGIKNNSYVGKTDSKTTIPLMPSDSKMDEMPPFDITITLNNEYGQSGTIVLYGVTIVNEGQTMSIEDMITEQTMQYYARDIGTFNTGG